jgi:hypothetical protein
MTPEARQHAIQAVEAEWNVQFCDDYRTFMLLTDLEAGRTDWPVPRDFSLPGDLANYRDHTLMGAMHLSYYTQHLDQLRFWHPALLQVAYPVGKTGNGAWCMQIAAGLRRGQIYEANHEAYFGLANALAVGEPTDWVVEMGLPDPQHATPAERVDLFLHPQIRVLFEGRLADSFRSYGGAVLLDRVKDEDDAPPPAPEPTAFQLGLFSG